MSWLNSNISSQEAAQLLMKKGTDGSFLVRLSENEDSTNYVLTYRQDGAVKNVTIINEGDSFYFNAIKSESKHSSLSSLVEFARTSNLMDENDSPLVLKDPLIVYCEMTPSKEKWYHGDILGCEAEKRLLQCGEDGCFLIRQSRHNPGSFVLSVLRNDKVIHVVMELSSDFKSVNIKGNLHKFESFSKLINFYQNNLLRTNKEDIKLRSFVNTTRFNVLEIKKRMMELGGLTTEDEDNAAEGYQKEFEELKGMNDELISHGDLTSVGAKVENKKKNRFKNILPNDSTRVTLTDNPHQNASDYINANYIQHPLTSTKYIATQGPLKHTVNDFWRMIFQEDVCIIVMTTKEVEGGKNKCVRYWPTREEGDKDCVVHNGVIRISHVSEFSYSDYILREFQLTRWIESEDENENELIQDCDPRKIFHFHYTGWPDHGVPNLTGILNFLVDINQYYQKYGGYLLVHCSAGIGRTGTIIIIDILVNEIKNKGVKSSIDIFEIIKTVRQQRNGMVQTETQYQFIYQAIYQFVEDFIKTSNLTETNEDHVYNN